jgi:DNA-directed RNA polymerase specialized sigma24 family protein
MAERSESCQGGKLEGALLDFEAVFQEYRPRIHRYLLRMTRDEAEAVSHDHLRRRETRQAKAAVSLDEKESQGEMIGDDSSPSPDQGAARAEMSACVQNYVEDLPPLYRAVLALSESEGLKNQEIADVLGCSLDTVKIRLHRARKMLRETLNTACDFAYDERNVFVCERKPACDGGSEGTCPPGS